MKVSIIELKRLLFELMDKRPDISIRFRLMGQMWKPSFLHVMTLPESGGVLFFDETTQMVTRVSSIQNIIQFEIDNNFQVYNAHFHYDVVLDYNT